VALYQRERSSGSCPAGLRFALAAWMRLSQNEIIASASGGAFGETFKNNSAPCGRRRRGGVIKVN
jgi:hypothetical protein